MMTKLVFPFLRVKTVNRFVFKGNKAMMGDAFFNSLRNLDGDFRVGLGCAAYMF